MTSKVKPSEALAASSSDDSLRPQQRNHDWRWAQDHLRSGESISVLIQRLEDYRYDKPRPRYYARRTVTKKSGPKPGTDAHAVRHHQITAQSQNPRHKHRGVLF